MLKCVLIIFNHKPCAKRERVFLTYEETEPQTQVFKSSGFDKS